MSEEIVKLGLEDDFIKFLESADFGEISEDGNNKYARVINGGDEERGTIEVWKLSPNGLTGTGFSPFLREYYWKLVNPAFSNDSKMAELVDTL